MNSRQEQLLAEITEEYVKTALPVGSKLLSERYHEDLSSATVRNDMAILEKEGFVTQPHTSAGRIPTEKGYRYLLKKIDFHAQPSIKERKIISMNVNNVSGNERVKRFAKNVAELARNAVVVSFKHRDVYYTGLSYLFSHPEFAMQARVCYLSDVVDHLDEVMSELSAIIKDDIEVKIGSENLFGDGCGLVVTKYKGNGIFGVLGPMRMDYQAVVARVNYTQKLLK